MKKNMLGLLAIAILAVTGTASAADVMTLNGAGATFPYPLYSKWFSDYRKVDPSVEINYQSIGSGGGIRQLLDKTVDFGASDAPMTDEQLKKATTPIIHLPTVLGAVVMTYNMPELKKPLRITGEVLAKIYLGEITSWDDAQIAKLNPGIRLPKTPLVVVHRSDGSGTSAVFTDYLSKISAEWKSKVGSSTSVNWPVGLGGKGNEGVTGLVKQTPGSVGYVELTYAATNGLPIALLKNKAGQFVEASPKSVTAAAAAGAKMMPKDFRVSITDAEGKDAYPISSFTYLLAYTKMPAMKAGHFKKFVDWAMGDGQKMAEPLHYAPLPKALVPAVKAKAAEIQAE